jgi:hypothetical protein
MVPVAKKLIVDADATDRAVACGQAALAQIYARNMLRVVAGEPFVDSDGDGIWSSGESYIDYYDPAYDVYNPPYGGYISYAPASLPDPGGYGAPTVCIDPLTIARNDGVAEAAVFPYYGFPGNVAGGTRMPRMTPFPVHLGTPALHLSLASRVFTWGDDVVFTLPEGDERPQRVYGSGADAAWGEQGTDDDGNGVTDDISEAGFPNTDDTATPQGDYSWLATVAPAESERAMDPYNFQADMLGGTRVLFTVSVAVFRKRSLVVNLDQGVPSERMCLADFVGGGLGGGDVRLHLPNMDSAPEDYFKVRPNQWVMLVGFVADPASTTVSLPSGGSGLNRRVYRWYRVAAVASDYYESGDLRNDLARDITLAGPDWTPADTTFVAGESGVDTDGDGLADSAYDFDGDASNGATVECCLFDDCVGVYEKTIALEQTSLWAQ